MSKASGYSGLTSHNSQTRLQTSSSQLSHKYNTSGDQVNILMKGDSNKGN